MSDNATVLASSSNLTPDVGGSQTRVASGTHRARFLLGFFPPTETRGYLQACGVPVTDVDQSALDREHIVARAHAAQVGMRTETTVTPIPSHPHLDALRAEPTFPEHGANAISVAFALVDVGALLACQPRVDWDHVEQLRGRAPVVGDTEGLLKFCLPLQGDVPAAPTPPTFNPATSTHSWLIDNPDFRFCGPVVGAQSNTGRGIVGFSVGRGLHQMGVVSFAGKHMLNNGYHRAVALLLAGHTQMPVIVATVPSPEAAPTARAGMFSPAAVFGPAPPRLVDFVGPAAMEVPCKRMRLLFTVHAEVHPVPA